MISLRPFVRAAGRAAAVLIGFAQAGFAADVTPHLQRGKDLEAQKNYAEAAAAYSRALDLEPNNPTALALRGAARHRAGDLAGALADFDRCLAADPAYDGARYQRSLVHAARRDFEAAATDLTELMRRAPTNTRYPYDLARAYQRLGRHPEAMQAAETMLRLAPDNVNSWALRSMLRERTGDLAGALADTEKALSLARDDKSVAMYSKDRDRLQAAVRAAPSATSATPSSVRVPAAKKPEVPPAVATAPTPAAAASKFEPLDLRQLSAIQYNGAVSVAMEGLRAVFAPMSATATARFEKQWAPLFSKPSAATTAYLNQLIPLVQEFLAVRSLCGESAAAYDKAIEEAHFAAGYGHEAGVAVALAEAGRSKAAVEEAQTRLRGLMARIEELGDPPSPAVAQQRQRRRHTDAVRTARRAAGLTADVSWLRLEFPDLPEGWVVTFPRFRDGRAMRGSSLRATSAAKQEPTAALSDFRFRPPADERFAFLEFGGSSLHYSYLGADLLSLAEIQVNVDAVQRPLASLDEAIKASVSRDYFFPPEKPWNPDYVARLAQLPKPRAVESNFNGAPAYLIESHHFDSPMSGGHRGMVRTYFVRPDDTEPNAWLRFEIRVSCPYDRHLDLPAESGMEADVLARKAACAARIERRLSDLIASQFYTLAEEVPVGEAARQQGLLAHAHSHHTAWPAFTEYPEEAQPWSTGRWKRWPEPFYQSTGGLPKEQRAPRPPGLTDNSAEVSPDDGRTVFLHSWTLVPSEVAPGPLALELTSSNTRRATTKDGDVINYTSKVNVRAFEGSAETAVVFSDPKRGPQKTTARLSTVVKSAKKPFDTASLYIEADNSPRDTEVELTYQWVWEVPANNPAIPEFFYINRVAAKAPPAPTAEDLKREEAAKKEKQERIAEIRHNIGYLEKCLAAERAEQARAADPARRADYQFRILGLESDILAEQDLIKTLETGEIVHTRTPFEQYAAATFEQQCQAEARAASLAHRAVESAHRLAALLPAEEAAQAREFVARQLNPKVLAEHDVAKIRQVVGAVATKVQGHWQGQAARAEADAAAAEFGVEAATNIRTAAEYSMTACTLFGGGSINLIYQAGTGYVEGGIKQAARNALTTWSDAADYAFTAYDAYKEAGARGAAGAMMWKYAQGKATQYFAGKLMGTAGADGATAAGESTPPRRKPTLQEQFEAAKFQQEREWGEALVKDFQRTQSDLLKAGGSGAAPDLLQKLQSAARDKAAAVASSLHAKNYLKYVADAGTGRAYDTHMRTIHAEADALLKRQMKAAGWNADEWELVEFRNSASLGKPNMDRDVGLRERSLWVLDDSGLPAKGVRNPDAWTVGPNGRPMPKPQLTKGGQPMSLDDWRDEAQRLYNRAYHQASGGRSAEVAMEGITTSTHPEAYKDLLWLGNDKTIVSSAWAGQAGDVTRYKANHLLSKGDPSVSYFTKLQEVSRGTAKDMETKVLPLLASAKPSAGSVDSLNLARGHWAEVHRTLQAFGRNDLDPLTATRRIRELTGGRSIPEVVDEMATLMESLVKGRR